MTVSMFAQVLEMLGWKKINTFIVALELLEANIIIMPT